MHRFGLACLMANSLVGYKDKELKGSSLIDLITIVLPLYELPADMEAASVIGSVLVHRETDFGGPALR